jgi:photosystem II stability/assembly factor-like uncharacterized protein
MKTKLACLLALIFPACVVAATATAASPTAPATHQMYASGSLTKAQKNSPTATDFGLFVRGADGTWKAFGPRVTSSGLTVRPGDTSYLLVPSSDGVVRSRDGGKTWRMVTGWEIGDVRCIVFDGVDPQLVYGATAWGPIRSTDGGESWHLVLSGLPKPYCQTLVADPHQRGRVILGTEDGLYLSTDAAQTWTRLDSPAAVVLRLARSPADPRLLLAGTQGRGAWVSRDNGASWAAVDAASAKANLYGAALHPTDASTLAVAGWGVGVRVSTDGGATWTDRSAGLPVKNVLLLAFDPDAPHRLWASTFEEGSFHSADLGRTWQNGGLYGANGTDYIFVPNPRR